MDKLFSDWMNHTINLFPSQVQCSLFSYSEMSHCHFAALAYIRQNASIFISLLVK